MSEGSMILVVDDDPDLRAAVADVLEDAGYPSLTAEHGQAALELLQRSSSLPALILLDLMMPVMNGLTFAGEVQKDPRLAEIPIVIFSAHTEQERVAERVHAAACVAKPIKLERLLELVDGMVRTIDHGRVSHHP